MRNADQVYSKDFKKKKATTKAKRQARQDDSRTTLTIPFISKSLTNGIRRAV
jgi:hypothetical protein